MAFLTEDARSEIRAICEAQVDWDELVTNYTTATTPAEKREIAGEISVALLDQFRRGFYRDIEKANLGDDGDVVSTLGYKLATIIDAYSKKGGNFVALAKTAIRNHLQDEQRTAAAARQTIQRRKTAMTPTKRTGRSGEVMEPRPEKPMLGPGEQRAIRGVMAQVMKQLETQKPDVAKFIKALTGWETSPDYTDIALAVLAKKIPRKILKPGTIEPGVFDVAGRQVKGGKIVKRGGGFKKGELKRALQQIGQETSGSSAVWAQRARKTFAQMVCARMVKDRRLNHLFPTDVDCKELAASVEYDAQQLIEATSLIYGVDADLTEAEVVDMIFDLCVRATEES